MPTKDEIKAFLEEYKLLCLKYGVYIEGCGCCDSPFLSETKKKTIDGHIGHLITGWGEDD